jgi:hypothetical protein
MNLIRRWYQWRISRLSRKLHIQEARCRLLLESARAYQSSYYVDQFNEAYCVRVEKESELKYLNALLEK